VTPGGARGPLLVVIDMQRLFRDPESPWATPGFDELAGPITRLADAFGDRTVFTRFLVPERFEGSWVPYYERWSEVTRPERREWGELADPYAARRPRTLDRPTFGKWGPELDRLAGPDRTLVLCGVATDCCVIATALPAADAGAFVRVVGDACRGATARAHERALAIMEGFAPQIVVTSVEEELDRLGSRAPRRSATP